MSQKAPLMILPMPVARLISRPFLGVGEALSKRFPSMKQDLQETDLGMVPREYLAATIVNLLFYFLLFFGLLFVLNYRVQLKPLQESLLSSLGFAFLIFVLIGYTLIRYPKIIGGKKAEQIDRHLVFALKDLLMQISSGISLYNGFINVGKAGYGQVSVEFGKAARHINTGMPVDQALEKMAVETKSEYLKRTIWQLINTLKAGASLKGALRTIINDLTLDQRTKIRDYAHELNLWSLVYMMFAVAVPTIGATMLVILSSFAGLGITKGLFVGFIILCFFVQVILIGFVKTRRPIVNF
ncbi:type II secretion system F family protein [Candidatus Woesearchaeota archaeon]|nr:MAG: type II secretion system F family protein [Candidatus Woesearchaeota archaeon]